MLTRREILAAMTGALSGRERLRAAMARLRREAAMPTAPIRCLAGDGTGLVWANGGPPGSDLIWVRPINAQGQIVLARNLSGHQWAEGEPVLCEWMQTGPGANLLKVIHRERPAHTLYARLVWANGATYSHAGRIDEPWMVRVGTGEITPIGTHRFPVGELESAKTAQLNTWQAMGLFEGAGQNTDVIRMMDGRLSWHPDMIEFGSDGGVVRKLCQYHPTTGWLTDEPNLRPVNGLIPMNDNGRVGALDVDDLGNVFFVDTLSDGAGSAYNIVAIWRKIVGQDLELALAQQDFPGASGAGGAFLFVNNMDAGDGAGMVPSWAFEHLSQGLPRYINVFNAFRRVVDVAASGLAPSFFYEDAGVVGSYQPRHLLAWRADGGAYRFKNTGAGNICLLYFGTGDLDQSINWSIVSTFTDSEPFVSFASLQPYSAGGFIRRLRFDLGGLVNPFNAPNYYGPTIIGAGDAVTTLWRVIMHEFTVIKQAVVTVVEPAGLHGRLTDHATSNGKLYFTIGAVAAQSDSFTYDNPWIDPGIYEINPASPAGIRQVCGMPAGLAAGGWQNIWGDRRSAPV